MPIMPLASPLADPAPTALHIPTLQATHRMQQQASPAPAMMPMMPQTPTAQPQATLPRDFPSLTPRQLAVLAQLEMQDQQALRSSAHNILQAGLQTVAGGPAQSTGLGHTHALWSQDKTYSSDFDQSHTQHHEGRAAGAVHGHSTDAIADPGATAKTDDPAATARRAHRHPRSRSPSRPSRDQAFILRSRSQLGKLPVQDFSSAEEMRSKWSYRAPPTQHTGSRKGLSQSSQSQMEAGVPSVQYMDLTQEAATAQQQPPSRFRPSNYTVDLSNTTNPPPQIMVKPAVMLRRDERPQPVSFTVTGSGIPEATYSELAAILLSSSRRDQAVDISSKVMSVAEGVHQILFIPWAGRERTTFGVEEGETGSYYEYTAHL